MDKILRNKTFIVLSLVLGTIITIILYNYMTYNSNKNDLKYMVSNKNVYKSPMNNKNKSKKEINKDDDSFYIYICGSIKKPGAYKVKKGEIIWNVINKNGGFLKNADLNKLNMAKEVTKGEMVYIPKIGENADNIQPNKGQKIDNASIGKTSENAGKININTATEEQLDSLPKIGPTRAKTIIEYRKSNGEFKTINDLDNVDGIGKKIFEALKSKICV